jgi:diguanylate cyclase (GGDEF)-like protein
MQVGDSFFKTVIDIDHFKNVNDIYGHQVGDRVLQMIVQTLSSNVKSFDFVGRWGGEEYRSKNMGRNQVTID